MTFDRSTADPDALKDVRAVFAEGDLSTHNGEDSSSAYSAEDLSTGRLLGMNSDHLMASDIERQGSAVNVTRNTPDGQEPPGPSNGADQLQDNCSPLQQFSATSMADENHDHIAASQTNNGGQLLIREDSPVPTEVATEIIEEPETTAPIFTSHPAPGIVARDYAYAPSHNPPLVLVFPILTTYIWFMYNRMRVIKQKTRIVINAFQTAYTGCDLVHLMHFNWISMKDINCLDAREWLGQGLIQLYQRPQNVEISYGAKRPHPNSPLVRKWFSRFDRCKTIQENVIKVPPKRRRNYERQKINFYGPFGEAIHRYFPMEEHPVLRDLSQYLLGKAPKPSMSEKMEAVFRPILECHDGGVGGRGKPYERPRAEGDCELREGTAPELIDADPLVVAEEYSNVPAFVIYRKEREKQRERELRAAKKAEQERAEQERAEQERAEGSAPKRRTKNHNWTGRKSHKASEPPEVLIIDVDLEDGRRCTRSMAQAARETGKVPSIPQSQKVRGKMEGPRRGNDTIVTKDKGRAIPRLVDSPSRPGEENKGKDRASAVPSDTPTGSKRKRMEDKEDVDVEYSEPTPTAGEAGPSGMPTRSVIRRRIESDDEEVARRLQVLEDEESARVLDNEEQPECQRSMKRGRTEQEPSEEYDGPSKKRRLDKASSSERLIELHLLGEKSEAGSGTAAVGEEVPDPAISDAGTEPDDEQQAELEPQPLVPSPPVPQPAIPPPAQPIPAVPQVPGNAPAPRPLRRTETLLFYGKVYHPD